MSEEVNKNYVEKYLTQAQNTDSEAVKNDCIYRVGTQMEIIPCDGNTKLSPEQQQEILDEASKLLGDK